MCISRSHTEMSLPSSSMLGPFAQVPMETGKDVGAHTSLIILLEKGIYIEVPECVHHLFPWISRLKDRHIQSRGCQPFPLPTHLWPLCLCQQPAVSLAVEYPSESGAPLSGEEGHEPPLPTVVHWDLGGFPLSHTAPVWGMSLASVISPTLEALLAC